MAWAIAWRIMLRGLKTRLTAYHLAVLAVVVSLYALGSYGVTHRLLVATFDDANQRLLRPAAAGFAGSAQTFGELAHEFEEFALEPKERAAILHPDGRVRAWRGSGPVPGWVDPQAGPRTEGELRALVVPLVRAGRPQGALYVARSLVTERQALASLAAALLGMLPLSLLAAGLAGRWLADRAAAPVEAAIARERQFTRDTSHELRTPLAMMRAHLQLAQQMPGLPAEVAARLQAVDDASRRLAALADDLLALARGESGLAGQCLPFSLTEVVEEEALAITPLAAPRGIRLDLDVPDGPAPAQGDPPAIARAVRNLLDNAVRYAPAHSAISVTQSCQGGEHLVRVWSAGPPIPEADRERLFERFTRSPASDAANPTGAGLGLAIARAIATAHGGTLTLLADQGPGNTFELRVPVCALGEGGGPRAS